MIWQRCLALMTSLARVHETACETNAPNHYLLARRQDADLGSYDWQAVLAARMLPTGCIGNFSQIVRAAEASKMTAR